VRASQPSGDPLCLPSPHLGKGRLETALEAALDDQIGLAVTDEDQ